MSYSPLLFIFIFRSSLIRSMWATSRQLLHPFDMSPSIFEQFVAFCQKIVQNRFILLLFLLLLFKYSFLHLPPSPPHHPSPPHTSFPCFYPPLVIVHESFIIVPMNLSPFSPIIPSPLPSGHCQPVLNFNVFGHILLACLFCWLCSS